MVIENNFTGLMNLLQGFFQNTFVARLLSNAQQKVIFSKCSNFTNEKLIKFTNEKLIYITDCEVNIVDLASQLELSSSKNSKYGAQGDVKVGFLSKYLEILYIRLIICYITFEERL